MQTPPSRLTRQRPPVKVNHLNRDCREAVVVAVILAKQFGHDLYILYGHGRLLYGIRDEPSANRSAHNCYRITAAGEVIPYPGYPTADQLFASHPDQRP